MHIKRIHNYIVLFAEHFVNFAFKKIYVCIIWNSIRDGTLYRRNFGGAQQKIYCNYTIVHTTQQLSLQFNIYIYIKLFK